MVCRRYRPRQPRASPVWQVFRHHWPAYLMRQEAGTSEKYGPLAAHIPSAVTAFLRCGDLHAGFTRLRCPDCRHEYLLAFTCKQRGLCAACHQRRVLTEAPFIAEEVCADVPHRHLVLTITRLLRGYFMGRPAALGELALAARDVLTAWLRDRTGRADGQPGLVLVVQTFGVFLLWHPHVHVIATAGVFGPDGRFHLAPTGGWSELRELWRHAVLRRLNRAGILADWQTEHLLSWRHSGFTLDAGPATLAAGDRAGAVASPSISSAPLFLWRSSPTTRPRATSFTAPTVIGARSATSRSSAPTTSSPPSSPICPLRACRRSATTAGIATRARGLRAKSPPTAASGIAQAKPKSQRRRVRWHALIREVWGAEPLRCPLCPGFLRPVEWIETPDAIRAILEPLGLYEATTGPPAHAPPPNAGAELIDIETGSRFPLGPRTTSPLDLPRSQTDPLDHRRWMLSEVQDESRQPDAEEGFDQTGIELPPWREPRMDPRQTLLFGDDGIQADPPDSEPVFKLAGYTTEPADDFIQPDASENAGQ